jgi:hypothetical protein
MLSPSLLQSSLAVAWQWISPVSSTSVRMSLLVGDYLTLNPLFQLTTSKPWPSTHWLSLAQSQSYFMTGGLLPIGSSWHQAPWGSPPSFFFTTEPLQSQSLRNIFSDEKMGLSLINMLHLLSSAYSYITHIARYWKFFLLRYLQILCQSRLCKADHAYLTYATMAA